jgi:hypothetical protein
LATSPTWTAIDAIDPGLRVSGYTIDRGRQYELDRCDTGRATVTVNDRNGILDPTNAFLPAAQTIRPLLQVALGRRNPLDATWHTRFRGFIEELDYEFDPSQKVNRLTMGLVDIFEIVSVLEMFPGHFGDPPPTKSAGQVFFEDTAANDHHGMQIRVNQVMGDAGIPAAFFYAFSGNVSIHETTYSPGESAMTVVQEAADAEFPAVSNVYGNRQGVMMVHGRFARFDPVGTAGTVPGVWDFHDWKAGDGAAVNASPSDTAHVRGFQMNHGLSKLINRALATPIGIADAKVEAQFIEDATSKGMYGIRPWSTQNLLTKFGVVDGLDDIAETKTFASYYVQNYKDPQSRVSAVTFRSISPTAVGAAATWDLLCRCDIADRVAVTVGSPGGGGFAADQFFVEGVHEEARPLQPGYDDVTLSLDLSPANYFAANPWA